MDSDSFEVSELAAAIPEGARRAALHHAAGDTAAAREALEAAITARSDVRRPWHLLLDLERLSGRWSSYEALVARYRMRFGDEPPTERERRERESRLPEELRLGGPGCIALGGSLDAGQLAALASLRGAAAKHVVVHLDLSRLTAADPVGCRLLCAALQELVDAGSGVVLTGADQMPRLLAPLTAERPAVAAAWELLLLTQRLAQNRNGFERTALDYALAANLEAPAWEPLILPQPQAPATDERRGQPRYVARESMPLSGVIRGPEDPQMLAVAEYAQEQQYVNLNFSAVERIDLPAANALAGVVRSVAGSGRTIRLIRPNQLVATLFEMLNLGQQATIVNPHA